MEGQEGGDEEGGASAGAEAGAGCSSEEEVEEGAGEGGGAEAEAAGRGDGKGAEGVWDGPQPGDQGAGATSCQLGPRTSSSRLEAGGGAAEEDPFGDGRLAEKPGRWKWGRGLDGWRDGRTTRECRV